jgi:hypothetical protein
MVGYPEVIARSNFQRKAAVQFHSGGAQQSPNGTRGSSLLAKIVRRYAQFEDRGLLTLDLAHHYLVRLIHQRLRDIFHQLLAA